MFDELSARDLQALRLDPPLPALQPDFAEDHVRRAERPRQLQRVRTDRGIVELEVATPKRRIELLQREEIVPVRLHHDIEDDLGDSDPRASSRVGLRRERQDEDRVRREQGGEKDAHCRMLPTKEAPR
ncbi:MAG: hypothetical protein AUI90_05980 [Deltaproteobacteria bacterium 13_1_40CM_3_69_14]|nr:MAG: hypothetical protein AUI90_05980 [Deltaproteobacteria bacterium 13_1_40CM_3_69_14]